MGFEKSSSFYWFILDAFRITLTLKINTLWRVLQQYSCFILFSFAYEESFACYFRCKPTESSRVVYQTWFELVELSPEELPEEDGKYFYVWRKHRLWIKRWEIILIQGRRIKVILKTHNLSLAFWKDLCRIHWCSLTINGIIHLFGFNHPLEDFWHVCFSYG